MEQDDAGQQEPRGLLAVAAAVLAAEVEADRTEEDRVDDRPDDHVEPPLRRAEQHVPVPLAIALTRTHFISAPPSACSREVQEDLFQVGPPKSAATSVGFPFGDDVTTGHEHDPLAQPLDLDHVVAGDQQRGALLGAQALEPVPHRRATSGSSEAVGSSSTSSRGWCNVAFTMPTNVRCPDDSSFPWRTRDG